MSTHQSCPNCFPGFVAASASVGTIVLSSVLLVTTSAGPAAAQATQQVRVSGHVAPRCWTLLPARGSEALLLASPDSRQSVAARCNHSATPISMRVRHLGAADRRSTGPAVQPIDAPDGDRRAIEIFLSPTL